MKLFTVVRYWIDEDDDGEEVNIYHFLFTFSDIHKVNSYLQNILDKHMKEKRVKKLIEQSPEMVKFNKDEGSLEIEWEGCIEAYRTIVSELDVVEQERV